MKAKILTHTQNIDRIKGEMLKDENMKNEKESEMNEICALEKQLEMQVFQLDSTERELEHKRSEIGILYQKLGLRDVGSEDD